MNLPFQLRNDKGLREDNPLQPFKLVSLWEMLRFYADGFVNVTAVLADLGGILDALQRKHGLLGNGEAPSQEWQRKVKWLHQELTRLGLTQSVDIVGLLLNHFEGQAVVNRDRQKELINQSINAVIVELQNQVLLQVPAPGRIEYDRPETFLGKKIVDDFPELIKDASEAGNCFALKRYTACVFHLMRIMERLVQDFATKLGAVLTYKGDPIIIEYAEWNQIENAIKPIIENMKKGKRKSRCNAALETFSAIRLGVRNEIMHPRGIYDEEDARRLMANMKSFAWEVMALPPS